MLKGQKLYADEPFPASFMSFQQLENLHYI